MFDVENKERRPKVYEDPFLKEHPCQTQEEHALTLGVTKQVFSRRLKSLGMFQRHGNRIPCELDSRNIKWRFFYSKHDTIVLLHDNTPARFSKDVFKGVFIYFVLFLYGILGNHGFSHLKSMWYSIISIYLFTLTRLVFVEVNSVYFLH